MRNDKKSCLLGENFKGLISQAQKLNAKMVLIWDSLVQFLEMEEIGVRWQKWIILIPNKENSCIET